MREKKIQQLILLKISKLFFVAFLFGISILPNVLHAQNVSIDGTSIESWYAPIYFNAKNGLDVNVGNSLYISNTASRIGIGTTNPSYPLHVFGTGYFAQPIFVGTTTLSSDVATKAYADFIISGGVGSGTAGQTLRNNGSGWVGSSLLYNNATNIGVGTTNPLAPFHTYSATPAGGLVSIFQSGGATGYIQIQSTGSSWQIGATGNGLELYNNNTSASRATLTNAGSLGLGTQAPAYTLDVQGNGSFSNAILVGTTTLGTHIATKAYTDTALSTYWLATSTSVYFGNVGNVGIGVTAPAAKLDINGVMRMTAFRLGTTATAGNILIANASGVGTWQPASVPSTAFGTSMIRFRAPITMSANSFTFDSRTSAISTYFTCPTGYSLWSDGNAYWYADENGNPSYIGACYYPLATNDIFIWRSASSPASVTCPSGYTKWASTGYYGYGTYSSYNIYNGACYKGNPSSFTWEFYTGLGNPTSFVSCPSGYTAWYDSSAQWYSSTAGYYDYTGACYNASATTDVFKWRSTSPNAVTCPSGYTKWYPSANIYGPGGASSYVAVCYKGSPVSFPWEIYTGSAPSSYVSCPSGYTNWYDTTYAKYYTYDGSYQSYNGVCVNTSISAGDAFPYFSTTGSDAVSCPSGYSKWQGNTSYSAYRGSGNTAYSSACYKMLDTSSCVTCPSGWSSSSCQTVTIGGTDVKENVCYKMDSAVQTILLSAKGSNQSLSCPSNTWSQAAAPQNVLGNTELACYYACTNGLSAPSSPTSVSAVGGGLNANLSWTAPSGSTCAQAETYKIYRSTTSGSGYSLVTSGVTSTTYIDSGLTGGTTYYYKISAVNGGGESGFSSEVSAVPTTFTPMTFSNSSTGYTGTIQTWTVSSTGAYVIEAWGAQGGSSTNVGYTGGKGAYIKGTVTLNAGDVIKILVGQQGSSDGYRSSGGGGTFVVKQSGNVPLIVAGGGGGAGYSANGGDATITTTGGSPSPGGSRSGAPGSNGGGGGGGTAGSGGGGGGFCGSGGYGYTGAYDGTGGTGGTGCANGQPPSGSSGTPSTDAGGKAYTAGGNGGTATANGGFGGGGASISWNTVGGGGGGYSGGGGSGYDSSHSGGGGGASYNSGTNQTNTAGVRTGHGQVIISM